LGLEGETGGGKKEKWRGEMRREKEGEVEGNTPVTKNLNYKKQYYLANILPLCN